MAEVVPWTPSKVQEKLLSFFDKSARTPYVLGQNDCILEVGDWLKHCCGTKISDKWRGQYTSQDGFEAIAAQYGGLEQLLRKAFTDFGLEETSEPQAGDIGLLRTDEYGIMGGILLVSGRWRVRTPDRILTSRPPLVNIIVTWKLPCRSS